jgi:hypothetical protein
MSQCPRFEVRWSGNIGLSPCSNTASKTGRTFQRVHLLGAAKPAAVNDCNGSGPLENVGWKPGVDGELMSRE